MVVVEYPSLLILVYIFFFFICFIQNIIINNTLYHRLRSGCFCTYQIYSSSHSYIVCTHSFFAFTQQHVHNISILSFTLTRFFFCLHQMLFILSPPFFHTIRLLYIALSITHFLIHSYHQRFISYIRNISRHVLFAIFHTQKKITYN